MNTKHTYCSQIQDLILLNNSGELTAEQASDLTRHLDQCPACSSYQQDVEMLIAESRNSLPDGAPSYSAVEAVMSHAESLQHNIVYFTSPWRTASGIAAALAIMVGGYLALHTPTQSPADIGQSINNMQIVAALAADDYVEAPAESPEPTNEAQLKELAQKLLKLQGFSIEEKEEPADVTDLFLPTALQSRNTIVFPAGISV